MPNGTHRGKQHNPNNIVFNEYSQHNHALRHGQQQQ